MYFIWALLISKIVLKRRAVWMGGSGYVKLLYVPLGEGVGGGGQVHYVTLRTCPPPLPQWYTGALLFDEKIRQSATLFWFGLRDVGSLYSQAIIQRTIDGYPHFWSTVRRKRSSFRGLRTCKP
jgi:hypothetical protein